MIENPDFDKIEPTEFADIKHLMKYVLEMGLHETVKAVVPIEPEEIPEFAMLASFMSVDSQRSVVARVELGSSVEWNDEKYAWIASLNVMVHRIESKPPKLRSIK